MEKQSKHRSYTFTENNSKMDQKTILKMKSDKAPRRKYRTKLYNSGFDEQQMSKP